MRYVGVVALLIAAVAFAAAPVAQATGPCAKYERALKHAKTKAAKKKAKTALEKCKKENAPVVVSPANPYTDEAVHITIHPPHSLHEGWVYTYFVNASGGSSLTGTTGLAVKETTARSVLIFPSDGFGQYREWGDGKGSVIVSEGPPAKIGPEGVAEPSEEGSPLGFVSFRFIEKP